MLGRGYGDTRPLHWRVADQTLYGGVLSRVTRHIEGEHTWKQVWRSTSFFMYLSFNFWICCLLP